MALRFAALGFGLVAGFVMGWARLTDPETFRRMLHLESPTVYLLMGASAGVAFVGVRLLRGRRAPLTAERIAWTTEAPTRALVAGSAIFGVGWGISTACPGPVLAQVGAGRVLAIAVTAGVLVGVLVQPRLAAFAARRAGASHVPRLIADADVL